MDINIKDTALKGIRYSNGVQRKFKNKKVTLIETQEGVYQIELRDLKEGNCTYCKKIKQLRVAGLLISEETLNAIILNYMQHKKMKELIKRVDDMTC